MDEYAAMQHASALNNHAEIMMQHSRALLAQSDATEAQTRATAADRESRDVHTRALAMHSEVMTTLNSTLERIVGYGSSFGSSTEPSALERLEAVASKIRNAAEMMDEASRRR